MFVLDKAHYPIDLDKIYYAASLFEGQAANWYTKYPPLINKEAALQEGRKFNSGSVWLTWKHFHKALKDSFGGSLSRDKAVMEWESLRQRPGKINKYLDWITYPVWRMGYSGELTEDKIKHGLTPPLRQL